MWRPEPDGLRSIEGVETPVAGADARCMLSPTELDQRRRERTPWSARLCLWAWTLIACPLITLGAVDIAGSDGPGTKFFFLFIVFPAALAALGGWALPVRAGEAVLAALVAGGLGVALWVLSVVMAARSGVFD